jgi:hypothetical protein
MGERTGFEGLSAWLTLRQTRALLRGKGAKAIAVGVGGVYAVVSLLVGLMLEIVPTGVHSTTVTLLTGAYEPDWWNYPALLVVGPNGVLALPFFPTLSMIVVSIGVGLGMSAGLLVAVRLLRERKAARRGSGTASTLAGMTPAMVAVLTLGACCSTSAAAAAGIGAVAQASGTTYDQLLVNSWYLNVFQMVVLGVALLAQEQLLSIYRGIFGLSEDRGRPAEAARRRLWRTALPIGALRVALVIGGTIWSIAVLIDWTTLAPSSPPGAAIAAGFLEHPFVGGTAVLAALAPGAVVLVGARPGMRGFVSAYRILLFACGFALVIGLPPPVAGWGLAGAGNQLLGWAGVPASLGGAGAPNGGDPFASLTNLLLSLGLGIFALCLAARPRRLLLALEGRRVAASTGTFPSSDGRPNSTEREAGRSADSGARIDLAKIADAQSLSSGGFSP